MSERSSSRKFAFRERGKSFRCAVAGIRWLIVSEHNAKIHLAASAIVCTFAAVLRVSRSDWCWLIVAISLVWVVEALNTAFENLADVAAPDIHPVTACAKDVAAGAVLIASMAAAAIGLLVLSPYLQRWLQS